VIAALVHAMADSAFPCLLTEIVLACGFFSLVAINIVAIVQFGIATGIGMLLTWLANMTVLPLCLSLTRGGLSRRAEHAAQVERRPPWAVRTFARFVDWIADVVAERPRRVAAVASVIFVLAALAGTQVKRISYAFDDLRPGQPLYENLRFAERAHGGLVPVAVYIEADPSEKGDAPVFDPQIVALADRAAAMLESHAEIPQAMSLADPLRKAHGILTGNPTSGALPGSRALIAQEVSLFDDGKMLRELVSFDRRSLVALGWARDAGSDKIGAVLRDADAWAAREQAALDARPDGPRFHVRITGQMRLFDDVNQMLLAGLAGSLGGALLVTMLLFCVVLRSWRLALIGLVPNVAPLVIVLAMMWLAGVPLRPITVMSFSVTLVIADDDTIQFLARFRSHFARAKQKFAGQAGVNLHREAAQTCMREVGLPMFITSTAVSMGFLVLLGAQMTGTAHLGMIIGTTLFAAVFADLFLSPLLLSWLRPRV
jgi:predicted RND superfamily exporter protein